jgi:hypothetical protein
LVFNEISLFAVCRGLPHSGKYDFLNIGKTNVPQGIKENIINYYFHYFNCWFTRSHSEIYLKTPIGHGAYAKNKCAIDIIALFTM